MSTETMIHMATTDTAEQVTAPVLPADDRPGDGYDWMDTLDGTSWSVLPNWGSEGWDAGSWPYIIFAVARTRDGNGELFGYGTYVEGDTAAHWFRSQGACFEAITAEVFFHWASGQSDGPENLPEPALLELIANVLKLGDGDEVIWATDLNHGGPALLIAMLVAHGQNVLYIPGRIVHHASRLYRGEGKTDAKDAAVIADQARMRRDLQPLRAGDETSTGLRILTARRADKSADRVRAINRLQAQLLEYFPALERAFDYSRSKAALFLLTKHRTPDGIRRTGQARLHAWLKKHGARSSAAVAQAAVDAAKSQHTTVPAQHVGELIVAALAREIITLDKELAELDALIGEKVTEHRHARTLLSMPGFGPVLAAEFLGATGGDMTVFETADRFAGVAGLAPAPGTPAGLPATTTAPAATTGGCFGSSTSPASWP